jgi:hypothetical protein
MLFPNQIEQLEINVFLHNSVEINNGCFSLALSAKSSSTKI